MDARRQFHGDLETLQQDLLRMGALVEESIFKAVRALIDQNPELAAEVIAGHQAGKDWAAIPAAIFTDPEVASVGMTAESAREQGYEAKVGKFPFAALGRALAMGETDGFVKAVVDAKTGRILGMHAVGPSASELVAEATLALEMGAVAQDVMLTVHTHPTLSEAMMEACASALGQAIHAVNR